MSTMPTGGPAAGSDEDAESTDRARVLREWATGESVAGERGAASVHRARSVQSRLSSLLAIALMTVLGAGLLTWYYATMLARHGKAQHAAAEAQKVRASADSPLPPPGKFDPPVLVPAKPAPSAATVQPNPTVSASSSLLGPPPDLPAGLVRGATPSPIATSFPPAGRAGTGADLASTGAKSPGEIALERKLSGPAFAQSDSGGAPPPAALAAAQENAGSDNPPAAPRAVATGAEPLGGLLVPTVTPAVAASVLPTRRFLLPKGTFIDCTLETAIDSTLPGMTTCVTATDTFSADGEVVLLERGTKLVGETRGDVAQGSSRLFVLWSEARTPTGVVIPLASPGTDELGRSGLSGQVNRHFWQRFGAAMLISVIDGAVQAAALAAQSGNNAVIYSPTTSGNVVEEVLKSTISIPPTVTKAQGDRIQVLVARDLDFRSVYELRTVGTP